MVKPTMALKTGSIPVAAGNALAFKFFEKVKYELPVFVLLLLFYMPQNRSVTDDVYNSMNVFDYRIGFAPRLLVGSLMSLFTDYKSIRFMTVFWGMFFLFSAVFIAWLAGKVIRKAKTENKEITIFLVMLFFSVPFSLAVIYPRAASLDRFNVVLTLLALILINKWFVKWLVPVLLFLALAAYHQYAFMYMVVIAILVIYEIYRNNYSKQSIALCFVSFLSMAASSAYFYLYGGLEKFKDVDEIIPYYLARTDFPYVRLAFDRLLFKSPVEFFQDVKEPTWNLISNGLKEELFSTIFLLPLIALFFMIWKNAIKLSDKKLEKITLLLCILAPVARFPMFILSTNFFKSRIALVAVQFFLVFYFLYTGNKPVTEAVKRAGEFFKNHFLLFLLMIAYFASVFLIFQKGETWSLFQSELRGVFNRF